MCIKDFFKGFKNGFKEFGENISLIVNSALLSFVYLVGVGLTSLASKVFKKKFLDTQISKKSKTYWSDLNLKKGLMMNITGNSEVKMKKNLINLNDLTSEELEKILKLSEKIKANPEDFADAMKQKTLLMVFEKPSLRTRISFETGMTKMGGHAIYYDVKTSPLGVGESVADTARCASRYVDIIMARLLKQSDTIELAKNSKIPVIDALSDVAHPCQILADLLTIKEKKGKLKGLKLSYFGDADNNVTYSLMHGCAMSGIDMYVASPNKESELNKKILDEARQIAKKEGCKLVITSDIKEAISNADVVVTDTWMSYHISQDQKETRVNLFMPYQVNKELMTKAKRDAIFMHCLPAKRGYEVTNEVVDGPQSVVFDEAENRMWTEMALLLFLMENKK